MLSVPFLPVTSCSNMGVHLVQKGMEGPVLFDYTIEWQPIHLFLQYHSLTLPRKVFPHPQFKILIISPLKIFSKKSSAISNVFHLAWKFYRLELITHIHQDAKMYVHPECSPKLFVIVMLPQNGTLSSHRKGKTDLRVWSQKDLHDVLKETSKVRYSGVPYVFRVCQLCLFPVISPSSCLSSPFIGSAF